MQEIQKIEPAELTIQDVQKYICPEATEKEIFMFLQVAKQCNLNPFLREIYLIKYGANPAQILTSYNTYIQRAEKSGKYAGLETATTGSIKSGDLKAIVKVFRKDWEKPLIHEAYYEEYAQYVTDKQSGQKRPNRFWGEKPRTMITKVAISQAFRLAFPLDFEGMPYTNDEINTIDIIPEQVKELIKAKKFSAPQEIPSKTAINGPRIEEAKETVQTTDSSSIVPPGKDLQKEQAESEPVSQEELTSIIKIAIKNGYLPKDINKMFIELGYKVKDKIKKSLQLKDIEPEITRWDLESLQESCSKVKK